MVLLWGDVTEACRAGLSCPVLTFDQVKCIWAMSSSALSVCSANNGCAWKRPLPSSFCQARVVVVHVPALHEA